MPVDDHASSPAQPFKPRIAMDWVGGDGFRPHAVRSAWYTVGAGQSGGYAGFGFGFRGCVSLEWRHGDLLNLDSVWDVRAKVGPTLRHRGAKSEANGKAVGGVRQAPAASEKYQRILDAAVEVIAENGYFNSPVSAIAAKAGVADGTIYLYFKSKDDVLRTAIDATFARFHGRVEEEFTRVTGPREQMEFIAQVHLESHENRSVAILMQTEMRQSAKFIAEFSHHHLVKYITLVREVVRRGQRVGIFRKDVSDGLVAHCLFGAIDELLSSAVFTGRAYDAKATAAQVVDVLLNGITAGGTDV